MKKQIFSFLLALTLILTVIPVAVSAANEDIPNSRWYTGTGIYRDVHLWVKNPLYIPLRGVILTAKAAEGQAEVNCRQAAS